MKIVSYLLRRALINSNNAVSYEKKLIQKWLDNVYSCTRNASKRFQNEYGLSINRLFSFTFGLLRLLNNLCFF